MKLSPGKRKRLESVSDSRGVIGALTVEAGAHCIKVLLYSALSDAPRIMDRKRAWVEGVGWKCAGCDVPFFLEIVPYQAGMDERNPEFARCQPGILTSAMQEFSQPRYCVDVLKFGVPVTMAYVQGSSASDGTFVHSRARIVPIVVIKCGLNGAVARRGKDQFHAPSLSVQPVDTVGAGDSSNAGFLHKFILGANLEGFLDYGSTAATLSTTRASGTEAFRDRQHRESLLQKARSLGKGGSREQSTIAQKVSR